MVLAVIIWQKKINIIEIKSNMIFKWRDKANFRRENENQFKL